MPIYEYKCKSCGEKFEMFRSIAASDSEIKCPRCGAQSPQRVFSTFAKGPSNGLCSPTGST